MESRRLINRIALGWGMAEGVLLFVIPDVLLTYVAVRYGVPRGLRAAVWAVAGALIGGTIAFAWGAASPESARTAMAALPAVDIAMIELVEEAVADEGPVALVAAPLGGRPFKLYAAAAGSTGASLPALWMWTIPGRLWRFAALAAIAGLASQAARAHLRRLPEWVPMAVWAISWLVVYGLFWSR